MSASTIIDLNSLPPPNAIEPLSYEAILAAYKAALKKGLADILPDWDPNLESDTIVKLAEAVAARELMLRAHANDVARSNLLAFAIGSDLDHLGAFYGVARRTGETDAEMRSRTQLKIVGWSCAGAAEHYRYWALSASPEVDDAAVDSPEPGVVRVAVLSREGDGVASPELLDTVRAVVGADDVRVLTDTLQVVAARVRPVDVTAKVWLYPDTPDAVFQGLAPALSSAVAQKRALGWDLTRSFVTGVLQAGGVYRVDLLTPTADTIVGADACVALGRVDIQFAGRDR